MRVLLVHNRYRSGAPGGEDLVFEHERDLLRRAGIRVSTYTRSNDEMDPSSFRDSFRVLAGLQRSGRTASELHSLIKRERPEVVHFHNTFPLISASGYLVCKEFDLPVVQTIHNFGLVCAARTFFRSGSVCRECEPGSYAPAIRYRCYRDSATASLAVAGMLWRNAFTDIHRRCVDRFIALTPFVADWLQGVGVDESRIIVKPNSVEVPTFSRGSTQDYAVFAGRLAPEKGIETLFQAWRLLPDIPLKIFGSGPLETTARQLAVPLGPRVQFMGSQPRTEVMGAIAGAKLLVMPSGWYEAAVPLVVLEAWGVGTPVVASRIGSTECIADGEEALQFNAGRADELAAAVNAVWHDPALATKLSQGGLRRFNSENTPAANLRILLSTYRQISSASDTQ